MRTHLIRGNAETGQAPDTDLGRRLRELPDQAGPPFDFAEWKRRTQTTSRSARRRLDAQAGPDLAQRRVPWLVAAAVVVLVAGLVAGLGLHHGLHGSRGLAAVRQVLSPGQVSVPVSVSISGAAPVAVPGVGHGLQQRPRRRLVRTDSQLAVMALEDRIAAVDDQLNAARLQEPLAQRVVVLQRDRAQLMESLVQVRYAQDLEEAQ